MDLQVLQLGGILLAPLVVAVVKGAREAGLADGWLPWLNAVLSTAFFALMMVVTNQPDLLVPVTVGLNGLMVFLASAGLYDRVQRPLRLET